MENLVIEAVREMAIEWAKSTEGKEQGKNAIIRFLKEEDYGYFEMDNFIKSLFNKEDWQEIAKAIAENLYVIGDIVFTSKGLAMSGEYNVYKA